MPEIPDLEAIRGFLNQRLPGTRIERAEFLIPVVFRVPKDEFISILEGNAFGETARRGKFLLFHLKSGHLLVINAMLAGRFQYVQPSEKRPAKTCLGPDALEVSADEFAARIRKFTGQIKNILVNHKFIAGIGNAYADEILFAARLHPYRKRTTLKDEDIARLYEAMHKVFAWATPIVAKQMQETLNYEERRDFLKVHRRGGEQCPVCGTKISEITAGQRITSFCRTCQPG
jgi:formamidopyrimidine-DNA glycosylase